MELQVPSRHIWLPDIVLYKSKLKGQSHVFCRELRWGGHATRSLTSHLAHRQVLEVKGTVSHVFPGIVGGGDNRTCSTRSLLHLNTQSFATSKLTTENEGSRFESWPNTVLTKANGIAKMSSVQQYGSQSPTNKSQRKRYKKY